MSRPPSVGRHGPLAAARRTVRYDGSVR
jgi:hypothetical protein